MAKGAVDFYTDKCKGCGLCVAVCPKHILEMDDATINAKGYHPAHVIAGREDECIGCSICGEMCPDLGITIEKE